MASKGLGPLPRTRGSALAHGCGMGGRVVLPLARAAAVSTGLRVPGEHRALAEAHDGLGRGELAQRVPDIHRDAHRVEQEEEDWG